MSLSKVLDVVIIGGGLSGLSAGNYLLKHQVSNFVVLEARDRVGGRTCSVNFHGHLVDVGGAYVGPFQNRILRLAREFGIKTYRTNITGKEVLTLSDGRRWEYAGSVPSSLNPFALLDLNYLFCQTQKLSDQVPAHMPWSNESLASKFDGMTIEDWLNSTGETEEGKDIYRATIRALLCVEPAEVSMFSWLFFVNSGLGMLRLCETTNGAQERQFRGGSQQISNRLREKLGFDHVLLGHVVKQIKWSSSSNFVEVRCENNREFRCRHLIIALAPSLYKTIEFEPELPEKKREATERMYMGSIIKTIHIFERPFWKENGFSGYLFSTSRTSDPVVCSYDDSSIEDQFYSLIGFIVADASRKWQTKTRHERQQAICQQYARAFRCDKMLTGCQAYIEQDWSAEQFSGGCYVDIMPKEVLTSLRNELYTPCGNNGQLLFAGSELATRWMGYMDGAVQAGERAAFEIITKYLKPDGIELPLEWIEEEPINEQEECQPLDVNKMVFRPSHIEMLLPRPSTVRWMLKVVLVTLICIAAIVVKSKLRN